MSNNRVGTVHLVGAGPGHPDDLTIRARKLIEKCDAFVYDYLVSEEVLGLTRRGCEHYCVGKRAGFHSVPQAEIEELLVRLALEGKEVVRLKGGDPFVFGRGGEEMERLRLNGIPYTIAPAVTAAIAGAARAEIPLSHRNFNAAVVFITGHRDPKGEGNEVDWAAYATLNATLCLYMAVGRIRSICLSLISGGMPADRPAAIVQWATTDEERILVATVGTLADAIERENISSPAIVYIGETVQLARLDLSFQG
ncbi:MAG: uroporphyrinogen-III C-methyltransferase [Puniceicoccaceae bacterium]